MLGLSPSRVLKGLERGVAGALVLAQENHISLSVIDVGVAAEEPYHRTVVQSVENKMRGGTYEHTLSL